MSSPIYLHDRTANYRPRHATLPLQQPFDPRTAMAANSNVPRKDWRVTFLIGAAAFLLALPAAYILFWPHPALIAAADRGIVISGPIVAFEQSTDLVRLRVAETGVARQVVVKSAGPEATQVTAEAKPGAGWISLRLPPSLVAAHSLDVSVR